MILRLQRHVALWSAWLMMWGFLYQGTSHAQDHVVPATDLQQQVRSSAAAKSRDIADIQRVLSLPAAQQVLSKAQVQPEEVRTAVAMLSQDELTRLAQQARLVEQDVQGGLIVALLALIGLVVVVIIVVNAVKRNKDNLGY